MFGGLCSEPPRTEISKDQCLSPSKSNVLAEGYENELIIVHRLGSDGWTNLHISHLLFTDKKTEV